MKPTNLLVFAFAFCLFSAIPRTTQAGVADELLDSTHDLRAQAELAQDVIPNWEAPVSDSWSVINGGSPFSQGSDAFVTIEDNSPGVDIGPAANTTVASLEDLDSN